MLAILGVVVLVVFLLAFFIGRTQEKIWMRWGILLAAGLALLIYVFLTFMRHA